MVADQTDSRDRRYEAGPIGSAPPFETLLGLGESVETKRTLEAPADARNLGAVLDRRSGIPFPRWFILGEEGSLLQKKTVVRLE